MKNVHQKSFIVTRAIKLQEVSKLEIFNKTKTEIWELMGISQGTSTPPTGVQGAVVFMKII